MNLMKDKKAAARASAILLLALTAAVLVVTLVTVLSRRDAPIRPSETVPAVLPEETDRPVIRPIPRTPETDPPVTDQKETDVPSGVDPDPGEAEEVSVPAEPDWTSPLAAASLMKPHSLTAQVFSLTMGDYRTHSGVDLGTTDGTPVFAAASGTVTGITDDPFMGRTVSIAHDSGYVSYYKNLAPLDVPGIAVGAAVHAGEKIGAIGESAIVEVSDEPHLHFEITKDGAPLDPLSVVSVRFSDEPVID